MAVTYSQYKGGAKMTFRVITPDNEVTDIRKVVVAETVGHEVPLSLERIDQELGDIEREIRDNTGRKALLEIKRAAVLKEAKKVKLKEK
jgi:hypothetical protein